MEEVASPQQENDLSSFLGPRAADAEAATAAASADPTRADAATEALDDMSLVTEVQATSRRHSCGLLSVASHRSDFFFLLRFWTVAVLELEEEAAPAGRVA